MKSTASYRMSKQSKGLASAILDSHQRGDFLRMTKEADLAALAALQRAKYKKSEPEVAATAS